MLRCLERFKPQLRIRYFLNESMVLLQQLFEFDESDELHGMLITVVLLSGLPYTIKAYKERGIPNPMMVFNSFRTADHTLRGIEAMHMIRKGEVIRTFPCPILRDADSRIIGFDGKIILKLEASFR